MILIIKSCKRFFTLLREYILDAWLFFRYSSLNKKYDSSEKISASVLAAVHSLERAFSLRETKSVFGKELVSSLNKDIALLGEKFAYEHFLYDTAISEYYSHILCAPNNNKLKPYKNFINIVNVKSTSYSNVIKNRHSIRDFGTDKLPLKPILSSIVMAKNYSPSVCNRQCWGVVLIKDKDTIRQVLSIQNGNRGIMDLQYILVITSSLSSFFEANERYQPYIDGGIFLMSLLNSLHYHNVAACTLNWSALNVTSDKLKKIADIHESNVIISLIGLGSYPKQLIKVASSRKKPLSRILRII